MSRNDYLFFIDEPKKHQRQKIKEISLERHEKWEMNENFIRMLHAMNTDKIYVFKIIYKKGVMHYSIKREPYDFTVGRTSVDDIKFIKKYFENAGWEVGVSYIKGFRSDESLGGVIYKRPE
jgi:hypothetical protein